MNKDNPTVSESLKDMKSAESIRDKQEQRSFFKDLTDKLDRVADTNAKLNKNVEKDPFNKETFVKSFLGNKINTDFISKTIMNKIQSYGSLGKKPEKLFTPVAMETINQGPILDNMTGNFIDVSKEETQQQVLGALKNLTKAFPEITKPFVYLSKKLFELKDITSHMSKTTDKTYDTELQIYSAITEQNEALKTLLLRQSGALPDFSKMNQTYLDKLKEGMKDIMTSVKEVMIDSYKKNTPSFIKTSLFGATKTFGIVGQLLGFVSNFARILIPFKSLFIGGVAASLFYSMFEYIGDFTKTGEALSDLMNVNSLSDVLPLLKGVFEDLGSDLSNMFAFSDKFKELITNIGNLVTNHIMPAFRAIYFDVMLKLAESMQSLFENYIIPGVDKFNEWWNSSGPADIDKYITNFTDIFIDGLNILFRDILPPIFDIITRAIETLWPVIEFISSIAKELIHSATIILPAVFNGFLRLFDDIIIFIQELLPALKQIFAPESFGEFFTGIENLLGSVGKFLLNTVDNLITFILDLLDVDQMMGLKEGETVLEGIGRFFTFIGDKIEGFFKSIRDSIESMLNKGIDFVVKYNPIVMLKNKIVELFKVITDMIPSMDNIITMLRDGAKSLGVSDWIIDKVLGEEKATPLVISNDNVGRDAQDLKNMGSNDPTVVVVPVATPSTPQPNHNRGRGHASTVSGVARTTPDMTPSDKRLYGTGGGGGR
jgi:hypothetical protein